MLMKFARKLIGRPGAPEALTPGILTYERQRALLSDSDATARGALARRADVEPEILYYLASDTSPAVRREVAANAATPRHADRVLSQDANDEVRVELARKIGRILPDLDPGQRTRIRELAIEVIETLAKDQLPRVRQIVAEEIKNSRHAPRHVVLALAKDVELVVAAPILEYSPLLNDDDLKEIIATSTVTGALSAIARRNEVSDDVADAIAATLDIPAVAALLANKSAQIREETLDMVIGDARGIAAWHEPLVFRPSLSIRAMRRIATFVAASLVDAMLERNQMPSELGDELRRAVRARIQTEDLGEPAPSAQVDLEIAQSEGRLDDAFICDAIMLGQRATVIEGLAMLSKLPGATVESVFKSKSGKAITAVAWKAGLTMRTALRLQADFAHLAPSAIVNAKDGVDYPMSEDELRLNLSLVGG